MGAQYALDVRQHPRNIPDLELKGTSKYVPLVGEPRVEPAWKEYDAFKNVMPPRRPTPV